MWLAVGMHVFIPVFELGRFLFFCFPRVTRLWSKKGHVFQVEVNDTHPRHGHNHTLTTNISFDGEMQEHTTPVPRASLKAFMQRTVLKAKTSVAWSSMQEDAVNTCMTSCHLSSLPEGTRT